MTSLTTFTTSTTFLAVAKFGGDTILDVFLYPSRFVVWEISDLSVLWGSVVGSTTWTDRLHSVSFSWWSPSCQELKLSDSKFVSWFWKTGHRQLSKTSTAPSHSIPSPPSIVSPTFRSRSWKTWKYPSWPSVYQVHQVLFSSVQK